VPRAPSQRWRGGGGGVAEWSNSACESQLKFKEKKSRVKESSKKQLQFVVR